MANIIETTQPDAGQDSRSIGRASRTYHVEAPPDAIIWGMVGDGSTNLPDRNEQHPNASLGKADNFFAKAKGNGDTCDVQVVYTTNGAARFADLTEPSEVGVFQFSDDITSDKEASIPFQFQRVLTYSVGGTPPQEQSILANTIETLKIQEPREAIQIKVSAASWGVSERTLVREQKNRLHLLDDGRLYRYDGAFASFDGYAAGARVAITHSWVYDEGTPWPGSVNAPAPTVGKFARWDWSIVGSGSSASFAYGRNDTTGFYLRPPYGIVQAFSPDDPSTQDWVFEVFFPLGVDALGWVNLPGVVI